MATAISHESESQGAAQEPNAPRSIKAEADERAPRSPRRFILPVVLALLAVGGGTWAFKTWSYGRAHVSTDNAQVDGSLVPVLAKVGGYVTAVSVSDNDRVREGQVLVQLDDAEYKVRLQQAEADLAAARATAGGRGTVGQAEAQVQGAASQRGVAEAQITAARANRDKATADLARMKELADKQIISRQQLDAAQAAADAAEANLRAVERQAAAAGASVVNAQAGERLALARVAAAQAARDNAALQLSYTHITAPLSGVVSRKQVEVGQLVQPGQPLMTIVADTGLWVTANFKETQMGDVRVGQPVVLEVDAYGGCEAQGKVESLSAATGAKFALLPPDNATGNFTKVVQRIPVRIALTRGCGTDRPLRPGMSVVAHVVKGGALSAER